ncbi:MAG: SIS domain-containing protein [Patescibacteria group bacterium]|nr:SIS domain-containing protein [Patescibacteria group bacterium]
MSEILDNITAQDQLDTSHLYQSIVDLAKQCSHAYTQANELKITPQPVKQLIISGMGGSGLAARIIESLYAPKLNVPFSRINDYHLPLWVNEDTLVICSSYSGNTEETLQTFQDALAKKCQIFIIGAGGELAALAQQNNLPMYKIDPVYNPSQQPRMAIGYSLIGQLVLVAKTGLLTVTDADLEQIKTTLTQVVKTNHREIPTKDNPAKQLAQALHSQQVVMVAAQHLTGAFHVVKNQMNENAKQLSHRHDLPELNHHLMEGLRFPLTNPQNVAFWIINSQLYSQKLQTRVKLTRDVIQKNKIKVFEFSVTAPTKLTQVFELIQFGSFVNYYLTVLNGLNPASIPWVNYFKKHLQGTSLQANFPNQ